MLAYIKRHMLLGQIKKWIPDINKKTLIFNAWMQRVGNQKAVI